MLVMKIVAFFSIACLAVAFFTALAISCANIHEDDDDE